MLSDLQAEQRGVQVSGWGLQVAGGARMPDACIHLKELVGPAIRELQAQLEKGKPAACQGLQTFWRHAPPPASPFSPPLGLGPGCPPNSRFPGWVPTRKGRRGRLTELLRAVERGRGFHKLVVWRKKKSRKQK